MYPSGDKEETAINIAVACNLLLPIEYMDQVIINKNTASDLEKAKRIFKAELEVSIMMMMMVLLLLMMMMMMMMMVLLLMMMMMMVVLLLMMMMMMMMITIY